METKPQHAGSQSVALLSCAKLFKKKVKPGLHSNPPPSVPTKRGSPCTPGPSTTWVIHSAAARILHKKQRHVGEFVGTKAFLLNVSLRSTLKEASVCVTRACVFGLQSADGPVYMDPPTL